MLQHRASRATVRDALNLLRADGLIERTQGIGTSVVSRAASAQLAEAHGACVPVEEQVFTRRIRPRVLNTSVLPAPDTALARLDLWGASEILCLEYLGLLEDEPVCVATNYVRFPEAGALQRTPFVADWYTFLSEAGLTFRESELIIGCAGADPPSAVALDLPVGHPVITIEQVIRDDRGSAFDLAFIVLRGDRFLFLSRASSERPHPDPANDGGFT